MNHRLVLLAGSAACAVLFSACASTHYIHIRHPLHVGSVDANEVPFESRLAEDVRGLPPGALSDTASLTEVTPERICLLTRLWTLDEEDPSRGDYNNYRIALLNDQDGVEQANGEVSLVEPEAHSYEGHVAEQVPNGTRQVCARWENRQCAQYRTETVYMTVYTPHIYGVTTRPANICFANQGFVTPSTTRVSLELDQIGPESMTFEWQFDSAVAGGDIDQDNGTATTVQPSGATGADPSGADTSGGETSGGEVTVEGTVSQ